MQIQIICSYKFLSTSPNRLGHNRHLVPKNFNFIFLGYLSMLKLYEHAQSCTAVQYYGIMPGEETVRRPVWPKGQRIGER